MTAKKKPALTAELSIVAYFNCGKCLAELPRGESPQSYKRFDGRLDAEVNVTISREIRRIEVTKGWQVSHEDRQMYVVRANGVEFGPYCDRTHAERIACELRAAIRESENEQ